METCAKCGKQVENTNDIATVNNEKWCIDCTYEDYKKYCLACQAEMRRKEKEINSTMYH